eukprot:COSAG04_NODE_15870_length_517_cov_842.476077_1_plen_41_part_01
MGGQEKGSGAHWMVFCAAPPPREPTPQRRKPAVEFENFARP